MLFNSWEFLILLLLTLPLYYLPAFHGKRRVWQIGLLLAASAVFYAWEEPRLLFLLFGSCLFNAVAVERILFWKRREQGDASRETRANGADSSAPPSRAIRVSRLTSRVSTERARRWLIATVGLNLGFLAFFKYAGFIAGQFPMGWLPTAWVSWLAGIPLPVGISFYTFQGISMVVDVWRDDVSEQTRKRLAGRGSQRVTSIRDTSFYIAFFPQLVAGPIVKAHEFVDQIGAKQFREIDWLTVRRGLIAGYFLKVFVADNLAEQTGTLTLGADLLATNGPLNLLPLLYGYSLQIFADFAGYSLIAIGLGALFGYKLPPNFNFPYLSTSITEFWRRWHLSLSSWLRDYLYFPLGGNRKGAGRTFFNLFLVMFLGGLWHGAAWKFALWGSLHGVFLALERLFARSQGSEVRSQEQMNSTSLSSISVLRLLSSALRWFTTFHLVTLLWLTFMMPDMASIAAFFKGIFSGNMSLQGPPAFSLMFYGTAVVIYHAWGWFNEHHHQKALKLHRPPIEGIIHGVMFFLVLTNPGAPRGFIYFQF